MGSTQDDFHTAPLELHKTTLHLSYMLTLDKNGEMDTQAVTRGREKLACTGTLNKIYLADFSLVK